MSTIDIIIIIIAAASLIYGFWKGFAVQMGAIAGVIVGILACKLFGDDEALWVGSILPSFSEDGVAAGFINKTIAYIILFILCYKLYVN